MTVALLIQHPEEAMIPVATERVFAETWLPAARALGLRWVPQFALGVPIGRDDLPEVLAELRRLEETLDPAVLPRLRLLVGRLEGLLATGGTIDAYIG